MNKFWMGAIVGVVALLVFKYLVFGLLRWDSVFHPGRVEPADSKFLVGVFG